MAMGTRTRNRQPTMWVPTMDLPTAASHPFYRRLNQLLRERGFDRIDESSIPFLSQYRPLRIWIGGTMVRGILVALFLGGVNVTLRAQQDPSCEKCCGYVDIENNIVPKLL